MAFLGIVILAATVYLCFTWTGAQWLLWMMVGVAAVVAQLNYSFWSPRLRRVEKRSPTLRALRDVQQKRSSQVESGLWRKLGEAAVVLVVVGSVAWLRRVNSTVHVYVWLQVALAAFMWFAVILGLITEVRLRMVYRKVLQKERSV